MNIQLSDRSTSLQPSVTMAVNAKATQLKRQGVDIINLSVGEPDFDTPDFIKQAAIQAIQQGFTKYTATDGIPELKQAIIHKLTRDNALQYEPKEIIVSNGVKHGLYNLCQVLLNPGDEAIIPAPYWVSYPAMVELAGGRSVIIPSDQASDFKITAKQLEAAITPKTRLFILNSPSNPSGKAYNAQELGELAAVLVKHPQIIIASDDMYEYILWSKEKFHNILNVCPSLRNQTVVFNGVSKAYAMTGWRIGYAAGPEKLVKAMEALQSQNSGNPNSIAQKASTCALMAEPKELQFMFDAFKSRHDQFLHDLRQIPGFQVSPADGTFYLFPNISDAASRLGLVDDVAFANYLLDNAHVACVPGTGFGTPGHIRFSYATSLENLKKAAERITNALKNK
jgi:aspartate aminotransferase